VSAVGPECWRRPPGHRALIYLDQSTTSDLARGNLLRLRELLKKGLAADRLICPSSDATDDETQLARPETREAIDNVADLNSAGVHFLEMRLTEWHEIEAAAEAFLGKAPSERELWREAFRTNPQAPREELFPGGFRVSVKIPQQEWEVAEVEHERSKEDKLNAAYEVARAAGRTFEEQARLEQEAMLKWKLGALLDPDSFNARLERLSREAGMEMMLGVNATLAPGSAYARYSAVDLVHTDNEALLARHPELLERIRDFGDYLLTGAVPALRLPALLRAGIGVTPGRRARSSDGYDVLHLTRGLSRCDIVTADSGMSQLCRDFRLVPPGCSLYGAREVPQLEAHLEALLT